MGKNDGSTRQYTKKASSQPPISSIRRFGFLDARGEGATGDTGGEKLTQRRDNKVWPTLQLVNRSDAGSRNWWETKTRSNQIQRLRMQTNVVGMPPATLEAAGTLIVDVVCSAESADSTAVNTEARPKRQRTARPEC